MVKEAVKASLHIMQFTDTWGVPNKKTLIFSLPRWDTQKNSSVRKVGLDTRYYASPINPI